MDYVPKFSEDQLVPGSYMPGSKGHCPQLRFTIAKPYGKLTAEQLNQEATHTNWSQTGPVLPLVSSVSLPLIHDKNLVRIPNYTGFIPRKQNYFGNTFSETCRKALAEFYQEGQERMQRSVELSPICSQLRAEPPRRSPDKVFTYKPLNPFVPPGRPYSMDDNNPQKYFMPGFSGHVPNARFIEGKTFTVTTNQALIEHGKQQSSKHNSHRGNSTAPSCSPHRGVIPAYTGHIPGYRFMYGQTFGQISQKLKEKKQQ